MTADCCTLPVFCAGFGLTAVYLRLYSHLFTAS